MDKNLKIGIIGFGRIGKRHAEHIQERAQLRAICDTNHDELLKAEQTYPNAKLTTRIQEFLNFDLDLIAVCTPNGLHYEHALEVLNSSKNVLIEKPMALNYLHCEKLIETSEKKGVKLMIVKQNRFNPPIIKVKELLDKNSLGKIYSVQLNCYWNRNSNYYHSSWKGTKALDGGILYTQFSHFIDILTWFFGNIVESKGLSMKNRNEIEIADTILCTTLFEQNIPVNMHFTINAFAKNMEGSITIFGENGTVKVGGQYLNELEYINCKFDLATEEVDNTRGANDYGDYKGSMSNHDKIYDNIIDVFNTNGEVKTSGIEGLRTVRNIHLIEEGLSFHADSKDNR